MKKKCLLMFTAILVLSLAALSWAEPSIEGKWLGTLEVSGAKLRIVFNIKQGPDGKLLSTLDSPDQGAKDIPVDETSFEKDHLHLGVKGINGAYEGDANSDLSEIKGTWSQNGASLPLDLKRTDKVEEVVRPQDPKPPYPYDEREVSYENKKAGITFGGTLTLPKTGGPFPAVLLITGSGPEDRNETVFGHHPFLVLADYLTRQGIAVLRVDDRGVGKSTGSAERATSADFVGDVLSGVDFLKSQNEINSKQIGLIGHSEGGMIAPMAAVQSPDVAYIVLMGGPGITGGQLLLMQSSLILKANGTDSSLIEKDRQINEMAFAVAVSDADSSTASQKLHKILSDAIAEMSSQEQQALGISPSMVDIMVKQMVSPWLRYFLSYDPKPTLEKVKCPVLAIDSELDLQVPPKEDLQGINDALKAGGNKDFTTKEFPGLNHLFQHAKTGSPMEYSSIDETISPDVLKYISDWITAHTTNR